MFNIFTTNDNKIACFKVKLNWTKVVGSGQFDYSVYPVLPFEILSSQRVGRPSLHLLKVVWWWGGVVCLIIVSTSGPDLSRFRLSLVRLVTRSAKARFCQVGNQVRKVKDQVGQGQCQELDNNKPK